MLAHSINRRVTKHALPCSAPASVLSRPVSNWGRRRWPRWRDETDAEWKQFQLRIDAFHKQIEADPYGAIFGRSNEMLRGILRSPPEPESPRKKVPISTEPESSETAATRQQQDTLELTYDPISGRMVPKYGASITPAPEDASIHYSQSHHDPRDDALEAYDKKQNTTNAQSSDWLVQDASTGSSAFTVDSTPQSSGRDELQQSLAMYDQRMRAQPQTPPAPPSEWLVQEEHSTSLPRRPKLPENDIDLMTAADVRARMGIRKNASKETAQEKQQKRAQLEQAFTDIQKQDPSSEYQETLTKIKEAQAIFERRKKLEHDYELAEETNKHLEKNMSQILEPSISRFAKRTVDDGYSTVPTGLQTSFEREKTSGRDLATDIQSRTEAVQYDDGYTREPMGLQTSFEKEQASGHSLAEDIQAKTDPKNYMVDDGYSREPMGLETSFAREQASGYSLADDIKARTDPKEHLIDDGYSREPTGLETSYQRELESGRSLEAEIRARDNAHLTPLDDGYSREPTGLESSYTRELEAVRNGEKKSLEEELSHLSIGAASYSDVCSLQAPDSYASNGAAKSATAAPRSVEQRRKQEIAPDEVKDWYGYSLKPLGLQTSYEREIEACKNGERRSLEEELRQKGTGAAYDHSKFDAMGSGKRKSQDEEFAFPVDGGAVETMSTREDAAKLKGAREQRLQDIALVQEVREIYEKYYGKITSAHRQPEETSTASGTASANPENEGRVDEQVHQSLSTYDGKYPGAYNFTPDSLEAELAAQNSSLASQAAQEVAPEVSSMEQQSTFAASDTTADNAAQSTKTETRISFLEKPRVYKLLAFDPATKSLTTSQTTSTVHSPGERPIPLSVALSNLSHPAKFIPQLTSLQKDGYEPVASASNLLILRLRDDKSTKETQRRTSRPNPVDGTTIPLPPTPSMSPTGYMNLDPVMENPAVIKRSPRHKDDKKVRKTEPVFSGERARKEDSRGHSVRTVLTTLIWATAACYVAGVAGEVAKGY
ncbi:hypothetical protein MPH_07152 [Macrophomina phaseolina MS6]|uniref:Uncharacterized protein n=1 Tax=Macrophomina phaseolina (strain MS6) TaxID=1126212 RepID=K2RSL5_MACPH|nr:hypothetical protein MPH_07152 [Macrophomina phaseolina MS6]